MSYVRIKVCGITRPSDAEFAAELGADFIGLIFYPKSQRFLSSLRKAREVVASLPCSVARVGVFVDQAPETILRYRDRLRLDWAQLHGMESSANVRQLQREGLKVIKSHRVQHASDWARLAKSKAELRLVDNQTEGQPGGTGRTFDWSIRPAKPIDNLMLAGGISADNVLSAITLFHPMVVDVNSSVESKPGIKSHEKLNAFFKVVNRARNSA